MPANRIPLTSRASGIDNTWCSAYLDNGLPCPAELKKNNRDGATSDRLGGWWCNEHKNRAWLLDYASAHDFPQIRFCDGENNPCAIGNTMKSADLWKMAVAMTRNTVIIAAIAAMLANFEPGKKVA